MTQADERPDPELDRLLAEAAEPGAPSAAELDALYRGVRAEVARTEAGPTGWLRARSTVVRRALGLGSAVVVTLLTVIAMPPAEWTSLTTPRSLVALISLALLLSVALLVALRPTHLPPLPRWRVGALAVGSLVAAFVLAAVPVAGAAPPAEPVGDAIAHASPCMMVGILLGVPVYGVARLLDRGGQLLGPLLAALAAGLAGNLALQLHCPTGSSQHALAGHAPVTLVFVLGIGALELGLRRIRR